jgi:hypothetical protein
MARSRTCSHVKLKIFFLCFQPELVEKLIIVDISPVTVSQNLSMMPRYFEAMMSVQVDDNVPLSKARRMADEQLAKYVLVGVQKIIILLLQYLHYQNKSKHCVLCHI